jgi:large subunit ribosomal protein L13
MKEKGKSSELLRLAIKRMIPKGPLGRQQLSNCKIFNDSSHLHDSQKPIHLLIPNLNLKNAKKDNSISISNEK